MSSTIFEAADPNLFKVLTFLPPSEWFRVAVTRRQMLALDDREVQHLVNSAGWLEAGALDILPLGDASRLGRLYVVFTRLSVLGEDPNQREAKHPKYTPLHRAASGGHRGVARLLLSMRAYAGTRDRLGFSALQLATSNEECSGLIADLLLARGDANGANLAGVTPLHSAAGMGRKRACELLLAAGAEPTARSAADATPADLARRAADRREGEERRRFQDVAALLEDAERVQPNHPEGMPRANGWEPAAPGHWAGILSTGATPHLLLQVPPTAM